MAAKVSARSDEGLMMMQELDDRLKEQIDKLEHVRLAAVELKDTLSEVRLAPYTYTITTVPIENSCFKLRS